MKIDKPKKTLIKKITISFIALIFVMILLGMAYDIKEYYDCNESGGEIVEVERVTKLDSDYHNMDISIISKSKKCVRD